jgi:hypothetical protein
MRKLEEKLIKEFEEKLKKELQAYKQEIAKEVVQQGNDAE